MIREKIIKEFELSGMTVYKLSKETGIQQTTLHNYLRRKTGIGDKNADKLFFVLGIKLK